MTDAPDPTTGSSDDAATDNDAGRPDADPTVDQQAALRDAVDNERDEGSAASGA